MAAIPAATLKVGGINSNENPLPAIPKQSQRVAPSSTTANDASFKWLPSHSVRLQTKSQLYFGCDEEDDESLKKAETAAVHLQSIYRGFKSRKMVKRIYRTSNTISEFAFAALIHEIHLWRRGWIKLSFHFLLWLTAVLTANYTVFAKGTEAYDMENVLVQTIQSVTFGSNNDDYASVQNGEDLKQLLYAFIETISRPDPNENVYKCPFESFNQELCSNETYLINYADDCVTITNGSLFLDRANRMQIGLVVVQQRVTLAECPGQVNDIMDQIKDIASELCFTQTDTEEFRTGFQLPQEGYIRESFIYSKSYDGYPAFIDIGLRNLNPQHSLCEARMLMDGYNWIDKQTNKVELFLVLQNRNVLGRYAISRLTFDFTNGGNVNKELYVASALTDRSVTAATACSCLYLIMILVHIYRYGKKFIYKPKSLLRSPVRILEGMYLGLNIATMVYSFLFIYTFVTQLENGLQESAKNFDDLASGVKREALADDLYTLIIPIFDIVHQQIVMVKLFSYVLIFMAFVTVSLLDFHPSIAFISKTLTKGLRDLCTFFSVFFLIVISYSVVGVLIFSSSTPEFIDVLETAGVLVLTGAGNVDFLSELAYDEDLAAVYGSFLLKFYLWSYFFIMTLILFNILLSIIVESYFNYKNERDREGILTVVESFWLAVRIVGYDIKHLYVPCCFGCRCSRKENTDGLINNKPLQDNPFGGIRSAPRGEKENSFPDAVNDVEKGKLNLTITKPGGAHSFIQRLTMLYDNLPFRKSVYTYALRHELNDLMGVYFTDRVIYLLRRRTTDLKFSQSYTNVDLVLSQHVHTAYTVDLLLKIREILNKMELEKKGQGRSVTPPLDR